MSSPEKVQEYLQRHKVGVLFEDLMAKVINDMPDDPVVYLARILHLRADRKVYYHDAWRKEGRSMRRSTDLDNEAVAKKNYDKPWTTNSKRQRPKDLDTKTGKKTTTGKPEWDHKTKNAAVSSSFEDIWLDKKARSPTKGHLTAGWADTQAEDGEDVSYDIYGYRGPHKTRIDQDNPLAGELSLSSDKRTKTVNKKPAMASMSKRSGRGVDSARSKAALQLYIQQHDQKTDSGIEEDRYQDSDDATELIEDLDDLRREGVKNVNKSGQRMKSARRPGSTPHTPVRVSICARCAQVMGGAVPSQPAEGAKFAELTNFDYDTQQAVTTTRGYTARTDPVVSEDDEEFESVSQVTGPRRPVWQESDNEAVTPRKGKHMLTSNMSPSKGMPMYSSDQPQMSSLSHKKSGGSPTKSAQFHTHRNLAEDDSHMRMTWSPAMDGADYSETKPKTARTVTIATDRNEKDDEFLSQTARTDGTGWQVPPGYDTDSSFYGSPGAKKPARVDRIY